MDKFTLGIPMVPPDEEADQAFMRIAEIAKEFGLLVAAEDDGGVMVIVTPGEQRSQKCRQQALDACGLDEMEEETSHPSITRDTHIPKPSEPGDPVPNPKVPCSTKGCLGTVEVIRTSEANPLCFYCSANQIDEVLKNDKF